MRKSLGLLTLMLMMSVGVPIRAIATVIKTIQWEKNVFVLAQQTASLCRQVNDKQGLTVHKRPTPNSPAVGTVDANQQVTLIEGYRDIRGPDGRTWIEITSPIPGFVSRGFPGNETDLIECSEVVKETPGESPAQNTPVDNRTKEVSPTPESASPAQNTPVDNRTKEASPTPESASEKVNENLCRQIDKKKAPRGLAVRADASRKSEVRGGVGADSKVTLVENYRLIPDKDGESRKWVEINSPVRGFVSAGNLVECE